MIRKTLFGLGIGMSALMAAGSMLVIVSWYLDAAEERNRAHWVQGYVDPSVTLTVQRDPFASPSVYS